MGVVVRRYMYNFSTRENYYTHVINRSLAFGNAHILVFLELIGTINVYSATLNGTVLHNGYGTERNKCSRCERSIRCYM